MAKSHTLAEIARIVGGEVRGDGGVRVDSVAAIQSAGVSSITWITNARYADQVATCRAGAILAPKNVGATPMPAILCPSLDAAVGLTINLFAPEIPSPSVGVHPTAVVASSVRLAPTAAIGPHVVVEADACIGERAILHAGVYVGAGSTVGDDSRLWNNVVVREGCTIGRRAIIHPNAVIGGDGFGFYQSAGRHHKIAHAGSVIIEDDVEIGSCSCVDRAKVGSTIVGEGSKIDNLVQVGHNVRLGKHCLVVAHVGLGGSATLGDHVVLAGHSTVREHRVVGDGAVGLAYSGVARDILPGVVVSGIPARENTARLRIQAACDRLPELIKRLGEIEARVQTIERSTNHS